MGNGPRFRVGGDVAGQSAHVHFDLAKRGLGGGAIVIVRGEEPERLIDFGCHQEAEERRLEGEWIAPEVNQPKQAEPAIVRHTSDATRSEARASATDRMTVLHHVIENAGATTLWECAHLMSNPNPMDAILSMINDKQIWIDVDRPMTPYTTVQIAEHAR